MFRLFPNKYKETTIPCKNCNSKLTAKRTCHEVYLECPACKATYTLQECLPQMDEALEGFLESLHCNRI